MYRADASNLISVSNDVERRLSGLEKGAGLVGKAIQGAFAAVGFLAVQKGIEAVGGAFSGSIGAAATFEKTLSGVKAVSGATAGEMGQLSSLALQLGKDTSFSASQAALGIEELVKGGLTIPDIMNGAAQATLNLAAAGGVSLPDAAAIAANALAVFNLKGSDMAHVADMIAGAANASSLDVNDFKFSLAAAGAVAAGSGQSFDDLAVAIAVMGQSGIKGSDAGTSLKTFLSNLQPTTKAQTAAMRDLGLITEDGANKFINANGSFKSMADVSAILQDATSGLTDSQRQMALETIFGSDAIRAATIFAKAGGTGFADMAGKMGMVTAESVGLERLNNTAGSIEQLKGSLETAGITIGRVFLPMGRELIDWGTKAVNGLIPFLETAGPQLAAKVAEGGKALLGFGRDVIAILGPVKDAAGGLLTAFQTGDFNAAFGPLLAALDAAFGPGTSAKVAKFTSDLLRGFQLVRDGFLTVQQALTGQWVGDDTVQPAVRAVGDFALRLRDFALTAKDVFFNQVLPAVQQVAGFIRDHMDTIAKVVAIGAAAFAAFSVLTTVAGWIASAITLFGALSSIVTGGSVAFGLIVALLGGPVTLAIAAVVGVVTLLAVAWSNNWGDIQGKVAAVWAWLQPVLADLGARLSAFWTDILPQLSAAWESVSTKVVAAAQWLWSGIQSVFGAVAGFLAAHGDTILAVLGGAWALIQNTINTYLGVIGNLIRGALALISGDWDGAWAYLQRAARIAWDGIVALVTTAGPLIGAALDGISATVNGWGVALHGWIGDKFSAIGATIRDYVTQYKNDTGQQFSDMGTIIHDRIARYITDTGQQFSDMGTAIRDQMTAIKNDVGDRFSALGAAIRGKLDDIQAWWRAGWSAVRAFVGDTWDGIVAGVSAALLSLYNGVTGKIADLRAWLNDRWNDIKATALNAWNSMVGQIVQAVIGLGLTVLTEIGKTELLLAQIFVRIAQKGLEKFTDLYNWVTGRVDALSSWVGGKIADLRDTLGGIWESVYTKAAGVWASLWKAVTGTADNVRDDLTGRITTARDSLAGLWDSVYKKATSAWSGVRDFAAQIAADMQAKITGPIDAAKVWLDGTWNSLYAKATGAWDGVRSWLLQTAAEMQSRITGPIDAAKLLLDTAWGAIYTKAIEAWNGVKLHLWNTGAEMLANITSPIDTAKTTLDTTWTTIQTKATGAWDAIKSHISGGGEDMKNALLWAFTEAAKVIDGIVKGFGNSIINQLNGAGDRVRKFGDGVRSIINWIAERLGAGGIADQSPSFSLPGLAGGTRNWGGGMAWVGEGPGGAGAELAYLPRGAQVLPHRDSMALVKQGVVAPPQSGPALVPGFAGGLDALGGIFGVLKQGAGWLYDQAKGAVGLGDLSLPGALGDIGSKMAGKVKDWALGSIDRMLKAATPVASAGGYVFPVQGYQGPVPQHWDGWRGSADLMAPEGTTILAMRGGRASSSVDSVGGNTVYIDGDDGLSYYYAHMRELSGVNGMVATGQQIGYVGRTGNAYKDGTGAFHLHLGVGHGIKSGPEAGSGGGIDFDLVNLLNGILDGSVDAPGKSTFGNGPSAGGTGGNWGDPSVAALDAYMSGKGVLAGWGDLIKGDSADRGIPVTLPMTIFGHESSFGNPGDGLTKYNNFSGLTGTGWDGQIGSTTGFARDFAIFDSKQHGIDAMLDNLTKYKGLTLRQTLAKWLTGDPNATADEKYSVKDYLTYAEQTIDKLGGSYDPDALRFADGGVITEPIVGRGQRSGRSYTFGERGPEGIFNADQMAALGARGGGETHIHHENSYTIVSSTPEITVNQLKREQRREERLRGYDR